MTDRQGESNIPPLTSLRGGIINQFSVASTPDFIAGPELQAEVRFFQDQFKIVQRKKRNALWCTMPQLQIFIGH